MSCHAVAGPSNEMFSDFQMHVIGVPQIAPGFGVGLGNVVFDGHGRDEDFGLEQITGNSADRYKFRSSPLRNLALQAAFFHNGAFTRLEDAIDHHLHMVESARNYNPSVAGTDDDLRYRLGPVEPVPARLDPLLRDPPRLTAEEFEDLVSFVRTGFTGFAGRALSLVFAGALPSGMLPLRFDGCQ